MSGLQSVSTSVVLNKGCQNRAKKAGCICSKCFAASLVNQYSSLDRCLQENHKILTGSILPASVLPLIPSRYFRFQAFAELTNYKEVVNYFNIAKKNPDTLCALWTKCPGIIAKAISLGYEKPANLQIVLSSPLINKPVKVVKYPFIDKVFTVYDKEGAKAVNINCGARSCLSCGRCYRDLIAGRKEGRRTRLYIGVLFRLLSSWSLWSSVDPETRGPLQAQPLKEDPPGILRP